MKIVKKKKYENENEITEKQEDVSTYNQPTFVMCSININFR